jgi:phospholipid-binding lipoprotein MlaA
MRRQLLVFSFAVVSIAVSGCARTQNGALGQTEIRDPFESANRRVHDFNVGFRSVIVEPVAKLTPAPILTSVSNVLGNLNSPLIFVNDLAQGRACAAGVTIGRFFVNTTVGLGGLFDVAGTQLGYHGHDNGFGQTLNVWGVVEGPYMVVPFLGPSNARGLVGMTGDFFLDPMDLAFSKAKLGRLNRPRAGGEVLIEQIEAAPQLAKLENTSLDGYAALRSAQMQSEVQARKPPPCPVTPARQESSRAYDVLQINK